MLVSWLGAAGRPALDHAFCRPQRIKLVPGLHHGVFAFAMSELRMRRPFITPRGLEQASSEILEMAQYTSQKQDPRSLALCGTWGVGREGNNEKWRNEMLCFLVLVQRYNSHRLLASVGYFGLYIGCKQSDYCSGEGLPLMTALLAFPHFYPCRIELYE